MNRPSPPDTVARDALRSNVLFRRAQLRLSQEALCKRARVSRVAVSRIENASGNVTLDVLGAVAAALETSIFELLRPVDPDMSDADIERRAADGPEAYVNADDFLAALDDGAGRYSNRGRKPLRASAAS